MNRVHQPRTLGVLGLNAGMGTAAGADELVGVPSDACAHPGPWRTPFILSTSEQNLERSCALYAIADELHLMVSHPNVSERA